jgi:hypothetical protein
MKQGESLKLLISIPAIALLLFGSTASAQVFKCTDASGGVQYRDTPCDSRTHSLRKIEEPAADTAAPDARMQKTQRLLDAMHDERQQKQHLAEEEKARQEQQRKRCNYARDNLRNLERAGRVYKLDESGNRVYLPDDGRDQALEQARTNVQHWCK